MMTAIDKWLKKTNHFFCCVLAAESVFLAVKWYLTREEWMIYMWFVFTALAIGLAIEWRAENRAARRGNDSPHS
jgi:hypothetical protein